MRTGPQYMVINIAFLRAALFSEMKRFNFRQLSQREMWERANHLARYRARMALNKE